MHRNSDLDGFRLDDQRTEFVAPTINQTSVDMEVMTQIATHGSETMLRSNDGELNAPSLATVASHRNRVQPVILPTAIGKSLKSAPHNDDIDTAVMSREDGPPDGSSQIPQTEWSPIYLGGVITLMSSMQFSLYFTSLWPFLKVLDPSASEAFFGVIIASYSFSQIIASPILGYWSNRIRCLKLPLQVCACFAFTGNALYVCAEALPFNPKYTLVLARFVAGIGATTLGLMKAYASSASISKDRSRAIAFITGGMAIGTTAGPGMQLFFTGIGYPGWRWSRNFGINMFNAPAIFCCAANIATLLLLKFFFKESFVGVLNKKKKKERKLESPKNTVSLPKYDQLAIGICYALRFTQMFVLTNLETIGSSFAMTMFSWSATDAVFYVSIGHAIKSLFAFLVYFSYIVFDMGKRVSDRLVCLLSVIVFLVFHLVTFSWPFLPNLVHVYNSTALGNNSFMSDAAVGCDIARYSWCETLTAVNVYVYYAFMCVSIGFAGSNVNVSLNTLFSKIIGPRFQGTQQGLLQMFGGSARMIGPLLVGFLYASSGPRLTWIVEMVVLGLMGILWCVYYKRLIPLVVPPELLEKQDSDVNVDNQESTVSTTAMLTEDLQKTSVHLSRISLYDEDEEDLRNGHNAVKYEKTLY